MTGASGLMKPPQTTTYVPCVAHGAQICRALCRSPPARRQRLTLAPDGIQSCRLSRQAGVCRAEGKGDNPVEQADKEIAEKIEEQVPGGPKLAPGQATAIVTGAISLVLGIAYLAFVFFLDSRGGSLQPPPPEAFGF